MRRLWDRSGWKVWTAIGLTIIVLALGATYLVGQAAMGARLMRADPDAVANDAGLRDFAISYARPAYDRYCASCHGDKMQGDRLKGAPSFTDRDWLYGEGRTAQIEHTILYGIRAGHAKTWNLAGMPAFAQAVPYARYEMPPLEPGEIRDLVEFLLVTGGKPGDADAGARGATIFANKGQCFDCHSADGQGDSAIGAPNLVDDIWLYGDGTREDIYSSIARGRAGSCPAWFQQLSPVTIRALAVLIYATSQIQPSATTSSLLRPAAE